MGMAVQRTALGPTLIVAIDQHDDRTLVPDPWAARVLPRPFRLLAALSRWAVVRRAMIAATEKSVRGGWASLLCRKRYIDDLARDAARGGVDAVVILGAGYDTRPYRVDELAGVPVWEVDLPDNIAAKTAALHRCFGRIPANVRLIPIDLETEDVLEVLMANGVQERSRVFVVWESVTMYLSEAVVRKTLQSLAGCAPGSRLAFTHFREDFVDGTELHGADAAYQRFAVERRLWKFGINPGDVATFLAEYGWREREQAGPTEYRDRYLRPVGRDCAVSEIERAVCAER